MTQHPVPADLLAAYLDDELDAPTRASLARHLDDCPQCRADVDGQRQVKRFLAPGSPLAPPQPAGLAARVRQRTLAAPLRPVRPPRPAFAWPRPWLAVPALAFVLLLGVVLGGMLVILASPSPAAAAAEMSLKDHAMAERMGAVPESPAGDLPQVRAELAVSLGMKVAAPNTIPPGFHFMGGRALMLGSAEGAHLAWMQDKTLLSFYQATDPGGGPPSGWHPVTLDERTYWVGGSGAEHAAFWRHDGMIYLVVGSLPETVLLDVARSVDPQS